MKAFGVGIIGCGLIGRKRAQALGSGGKLIACADIDFARAQKVGADYGATAYNDWRELIQQPEIEVIFISTLHDSLAQITYEALVANKHILVEKPAARCSSELKPILELQKNSNSLIRVGFNHRYHRSLRKARQLIDEGVIGEVMFLRARYGHGGRLGYDKEWRANPVLSGGGELIDQGPHLIDLSRWFLGDFECIQGFAHTYFWDMPVDDNGFLLLKTKDKKVAHLHVSCTEWKNMFSMEIYGKDGKIDLSGLGGSYGIEKITLYEMLPEMGPPKTTSWEFPMADDSWGIEIEEFFEDIRLARKPSAGIDDAFEALKIVEKVYKDSGYDHCA